MESNTYAIFIQDLSVKSRWQDTNLEINKESYFQDTSYEYTRQLLVWLECNDKGNKCISIGPLQDFRKEEVSVETNEV